MRAGELASKRNKRLKLSQKYVNGGVDEGKDEDKNDLNRD